MEIYLTEILPDGAMEDDRWEVNDGLTVEQFFGMVFRGCDREHYMMLVNDYPVDWNYRLRPGDHVYIRPYRQPPR